MGAKAIYEQMCIVNENIIKNEKWLTRNPKKNTQNTRAMGVGVMMVELGKQRETERQRE